MRNSWGNLLPHPSTLRAWYTIIDGKPGFTAEAFKAIKMQNELKSVICNIVIDEMSIKEELIYDNNRFYGGVDFGTEMDASSENVPLAKNALVFMAVAVNGSWKIPVGYFLIKNLTGSERANLLKICLELLNETGATVQSITFDGAPVNIAMCNSLGANFNYDSVHFKPYFYHPITDKKNYIFFDACHMLKLIRNCLGDKGVIMDNEQNKILWYYIKELNNIQKKEGLHLATKLTNKHINFNNHRMNVKIAAQTLSLSVASALLYLKEANYMNVFKDVAATSLFCKTFNDIFDVLNTKNKFSSKKDIILTKNNFIELKAKTENYNNYIENLTIPGGQKIIKSNRKTGFLGFIINLKNMFCLFQDINTEYLLTFKLSQDFLETFFGAIRSRGGFNNNPSAKQFESAYKKLLIRNEVKSFENSNCLADGIDILHVSSKRENFINVISGEDVDDLPVDIFDHDYINTMWSLSTFVEDVVEYIAGFVVNKLNKLNICKFCNQYLYKKETNNLLILLKNRGKYLYPSNEVVTICKYVELIFRKTKLGPKQKEIINIMLLKKCVNIFCDKHFVDHIKDQSILDNHRCQLIKLISNLYLKIRLHHECKLISEKNEYIRSKYHRLILFNNQ